MEKYENMQYVGERPLFAKTDAFISGCSFSDGESPLKECSNIIVSECNFLWRYPLWYGKTVSVDSSSFSVDTRAGMWYTDNLTVSNCVIDSPKNIRRCDGVKINNSVFNGGEETLWHCKNISIADTIIKGNYLALNSENLEINNLELDGKYSFDGVRNCVIRNSKLITKDAFWNSENVSVYDSYISAEYLGWNAKNLTLVNCEIESLQGVCYIDNLKMVNCKLKNTTLAFEYSTVDVDIDGYVDSVFNPAGGIIRADGIGELTLDSDYIDPSKTKIEIKNSDKKA